MIINRFNKWSEIEALRSKYIARLELKEKLNFQHFLDLGLQTGQLGDAKKQFAVWLRATIEQSSGK